MKEYYVYSIPKTGEILYIRKIFIQKNNKEYWIYKVYVPCNTIFKVFTETLLNFIETSNNVNIMSVDTSTDTPQIIPLNKLCGQKKNNQIVAINHIIDHWTVKNNFNTKVILYGKRGLGKTYTARLLKKTIQQLYIKERKNPVLYDDVNPSSIGLNINKQILSSATKLTPAIIVINEIDTIYDKVLSGVEPYDHRLQHSRNINDFHNMLDNIGDCPNVIAIYTTEKDAVDLYKDDKYKSFMRPGRIDFFLHMESDTTHKYNN